MGGRGGRGGASKRGLSFNVEALGFQKGEALPGPCLQPAPTYPLLEHHPTPLIVSSTSMVQLYFKVDFLNHFSREVKNLNYQWDHFPQELRPGVKKRKASVSGKAKELPSNSKAAKSDIANIDQLLAQLEKTETAQVKVEVEEKPEEEVGDEEEEFDESDEEMDDGTDYNQNYFDNGENYLDDDDDQDDGPTY